MFLQQYIEALKSVYEKPMLKVQTQRTTSHEKTSTSSLKPAYLCLQCPHIYSEETRDEHAEEKGHAFCMRIWSKVLDTS